LHVSIPLLSGWVVERLRPSFWRRSCGRNFLLVDDLDARREASRRHLRFVGTLGVLELAVRRGMVDLAASIDQLRAIGFRISESAVQEILRRASR